MRVNLSVAIVAMTDNTTSENPDIPTYNWNDKSVVLSAFFWGYIVLQPFAGWLGRTYGTKWFVIVAMFVNSTACIAIPFIADKLGSKGVMGCRFLQGLSQGFFFPSVQNLLGQWAPITERSRIATAVYSGVAFGTIVTYPITGYIAASWVGWPSTFYLFGAIGYGWSISWMIFGANSPSVHRTINEEEKIYIETSLGTTEDSQTVPIPWKAIFTSLPMWAFVVAWFGQNWGYATLLTQIPIYLDKMAGFDMHSNSLLSAAPYLAQFILSFVFGHISDFMINRSYLTRGNARKICNTIGTCVPATALLILGFLPKDAIAWSVVMIVIAGGVNSGVFCGYQVTPIDLSPKFAGTIMSIGSTSNLFSLLAPLAVQGIVTDEIQWRIVFIIASCMYVAANIFYVLFSSGENQWWDSIGHKEIKREDSEGSEGSDSSEGR
ncbi:hypothetical protein NQ314_017436 [Rhamnusium bicolor]|uniref:Putative inorganic phosphate cotransporter n=1 Tax=Rhamnusium bicolor TaxID=1586634 RepID=A0AAV8WTK0_9CUCU|nr:hypothetical protein NQ314_017436 [Rhamnusium bicolor]